MTMACGLLRITGSKDDSVAYLLSGEASILWEIAAYLYISILSIDVITLLYVWAILDLT